MPARPKYADVPFLKQAAAICRNQTALPQPTKDEPLAKDRVHKSNKESENCRSCEVDVHAPVLDDVAVDPLGPLNMGDGSQRLAVDAASRAPHPPPLRGSGDSHGGAEDGEFAVFDLVNGHVFHGGLHAALGAEAGFECAAGAAEFDSGQYATG